MENSNLKPETDVVASLDNGVTAESSDVLLEVKDLKKYFPVAKNFFGKPIKFLKAVDGISFTLKKGKTLGIVGESGCGKSTMGRSLLRLYDGVQGEIIFNGQNVANIKNKEFDKIRPNLQMIFQDPYASLSPRLTVGEIIGESARQHGLVDKAGFHDYVLNVMNMCGLQPHYFERYPHEFSGGQRQRICIARALALKPQLVVCDEPVSALDVSIQAQVINMLIDLREQLGLTYIFISHDLSVVKHISDDVGVMYLGNLVEYGSKEDIFSDTLHPYTKALFSAVPVPNPHVKMNRIMLRGDIPSPVNPPKGCKFHTRCEHCMEICERIAPEYREVKEGHFCACHLYNSQEDTARLFAQAEENEKQAAILAEKEANKPWNKAKTKVVTTVKGWFKKKDKAEESGENKQEEQLSEEEKAVGTAAEVETVTTPAQAEAEAAKKEETAREMQTQAPVQEEVKAETATPVQTESKAEAEKPAQAETATETEKPAQAETKTETAKPKKAAGKKQTKASESGEVTATAEEAAVTQKQEEVTAPKAAKPKRKAKTENVEEE